MTPIVWASIEAIRAISHQFAQRLHRKLYYAKKTPPQAHF
jgi:hypothetical protein